jgi:hypothetical protein
VSGGRLVLIEDDDSFCCACGKEKQGHHRGPRGGRMWKWRNDDGSEFCSAECVKNVTTEDDGEGDWQARQAEEKYAGQ